MKYNCEIIKDLLPLYVDNICSNQSRKIVEEHLEECPKCQSYFQEIKKTIIIEDVDDKSQEMVNILKRLKNKIIKRNIIIAILNLLIIIFTLFGTYKYLENANLQIKSSDITSVSLIDNNLVYRTPLYSLI